MSTYTNYFKNYYQANKERIKQYTIEYYEKNKERLQEYRKEYSKHYYQNVLKAKRRERRQKQNFSIHGVPPEESSVFASAPSAKSKTVKHKTITLETVESEPIVIMQETVLYPTQIVRGNFTLCFD